MKIMQSHLTASGSAAGGGGPTAQSAPASAAAHPSAAPTAGQNHAMCSHAGEALVVMMQVTQGWLHCAPGTPAVCTHKVLNP
jgi:hypothetical protein